MKKDSRDWVGAKSESSTRCFNTIKDNAKKATKKKGGKIKKLPKQAGREI